MDANPAANVSELVRMMCSGGKMRILIIDLDKESFSYMEDNSLRAKYLGGVGLNTYLLYKNTERAINPFDSKNHLFISSVPLQAQQSPLHPDAKQQRCRQQDILVHQIPGRHRGCDKIM